MSTQPNSTSVAELRQPLPPSLTPDQRVDMFSLRGFELAQRIGKAIATSNAVPAAYRAQVEKKSKEGSTWIDNPAAIGNCLVAIEVAQSVGMSITAVMQNANVIEGQLRWSGKFIIAAINACGRFHPLRFQLINKGVISATYREKQGWNKAKGGFDFEDITVEVENIECIAWTLPAGITFPVDIRTLQQAKERNLPVIEAAPVSIKMAVEEGWYGKSGSKWQTEMKHLMLQYRAGSFFGNIHAPDVVMGMGRTTEEAEDITTVDVDAQGRVTAVTTEELRRPIGDKAPAAEVVTQKNSVERHSEETPPAGDAPAADAAKPAEGVAAVAAEALPAMTYAEVADAIVKATTPIELDAARALIPRVVDAMQQAELNAKASAQHAVLTAPAVKPEATSRRKAVPNQSME